MRKRRAWTTEQDLGGVRRTRKGKAEGEWRRKPGAGPSDPPLSLYLPICLVGVRAKSSRLGMGKGKGKVEV